MPNPEPDTLTHRLVLMPSGRKGDVPHGMSVLDAAHRLGVDIESICGGLRTCGKCQIALERGSFPKHGITSTDEHLSPPGEDERSYAREHGIDLEQRRLSCAACIQGDVLITVPEESQARKQIIRKEASDLTIEVAPAVRLVYVEVEPAELGGLADWERVQQALADQWDLTDITLDPALLPWLSKALREGEWALTLTLWQDTEVIRVEPGYVEKLYGLAVDVGSTTIASYLCNLRTGEVVATASKMNPQVRYGEDLMSRVSYCMMEQQGVSRMHRAVIRAVNELAEEGAKAAGIQAADIVDLVLVGNSVMHHLLLGIDPVELGGAPFALTVHSPVDTKARDLGLDSVSVGARVHLLSCIAGHVGADNVGVLLAEQPNLDEQISLVVDIGTNAEILLGNRERMLSASSPTGPAFEGAQITHGQRAAPGAIERVRIDGEGALRFKVIGDERWSDEVEAGYSLGATGICGSGIIEVVAELFTAGLLDPGGLFVADAPERHPAVRQNGRTAELVLATPDQTASGEEIVVTQNDIRQIQLAKGALYAGVRLLMDRCGVDQVDRISLAGAFGSYIDPTHAMIIGLIPDCDLAHVQAVGNAAGDGARLALLNLEQRRLAARAARDVEYVETAVEGRFQEYFVAAMNLPHASDPFPHLAGIIPPPPPRGDRRERRRQRDRRRS
jgi:uncharacterized 2Fe-2S/4Fe-4S cluster protein (DUF4445 family)